VIAIRPLVGYTLLYNAMKLLSWNVNGIRACVRKDFAGFLLSAKPDIIGLQEIKIDEASRAQAEFDFADYLEYWNPAEKKGYSGTAVLTKVKPLSVKNGFGIAEFDREGRVQTLEFKDFYFVNAYFPNSKPGLIRIKYKEDFNAAMLKHIKKLEKKKPVILCGDLNVAREAIDLARPEANEGEPGYSEPERKWGKKFIDSGLIDTFRFLNPKKIQYSWWSYRAIGARSRNIGWRIDYFFVSAKIIKRVKKAFILDNIMGSDHCPVGLELK